MIAFYLSRVTFTYNNEFGIPNLAIISINLNLKDSYIPVIVLSTNYLKFLTWKKWGRVHGQMFYV